MHKCGDIVLVPFPFTDLSGQKVRPAVIVSKKDIGDDCILAFISTNLKEKTKFGVLVKMDKQNGLKSDSVIMVSKIATLEKKIILGKIGQLSSGHLGQVQEELKRLFF